MRIFEEKDKAELEKLIREDIKRKWNPKEERIEDFLYEYISEDIIDYMNATGLKLDWYIEGRLSDLKVKVEIIDKES